MEEDDDDDDDLAQFFLEWDMFQTKIVEKIKTQILYSMILSPKIVPFMIECGKIFRAGQATDDNMAHERCMLET